MQLKQDGVGFFPLYVQFSYERAFMLFLDDPQETEKRRAHREKNVLQI